MLHTQARDGLCFSDQTMATNDSDQNMATQGKKTAGYHPFRNVLPECNPILGSQLTAAATQLFSRDVRKRPAYVLCPWRYSGAVAYTRWISITLPLARLATP